MSNVHRGTGKPHQRIRDRLASWHLAAANQFFSTPEMKAYYFASAVESTSCWPRVLAGTMEQDRFHERTTRMMEAILRVTGVKP